MIAVRFSTLQFLAAAIGLISITPAVGEALCKPALSLNDVQFSPIEGPTLQRKWTAIVSVDASRCAANSTGFFEIVAMRLSETAPDLQFREQFFWSPPSIKVDLYFSADEAVERYRLENITPCICRD
jgi:hypothetical protein